MREFKFRQWCKGRRYESPGFFESGYIDKRWTSPLNSVDNMLQFIGLLDGNGKKIYEGDIVKVELLDKYYLQGSTFIARVEYYENECRFRLVRQRIGLEFWGFQQAKKIEVIGNIYENYELMETENG